MRQINDRITFDNLFRGLLLEGYSHEEVKGILMNNYAVNLLVFQESASSYWLLFFIGFTITYFFSI